jgi:hypothetical protein
MNRITPNGPVQAYKTYAVTSPLGSHFREATCAEVDCDASGYGWVTVIDVATDLGRQQAGYIRNHSGRSFTVTEVGTLVTFTFPAGQKCFQTHRVALDREPICSVRGGDWRAVTSPARVLRTDDWIDDFANHQDRLKTRIERG